MIIPPSNPNHNLPPSDAKRLVIKSTNLDPANNPDLDTIQSVVLRDSPKVRKVASYVRVTDRRTGEYHHKTLVIKSVKKLKAGDKEDPKHTISLTTEGGDDEIQKLIDFVQVLRTGTVPSETAQYVVVPAAPTADVQSLVELVRGATTSGKVSLLAEVLGKAVSDHELFDAILKRAERDPELFAHAAAAMNLAAFRKAVADLRALIDKPGVREVEFQQLLTMNLWMSDSSGSVRCHLGR